MKPAILIVEDEKGIRTTLKYFLSEEGYRVSTAANYREAVEKISCEKFSLIFADIILGGKTGIDLLQFVKERRMLCPVIMITGYPSINTASEAVRLGAFDYISKPVDKKTILNTAKIAMEHKKVLNENEKYKKHLEAVFMSVDDGIITVDKELKIISINKRAEEICNLSSPFFFEKPSECRGCVCLEALKKTVLNMKPVSLYRHECVSRYRRRQVVSLHTNPLIGNDNEFFGAVMVVKDETRLVELEEDLQNRQRFHNIIGQNKEMQKIYSLIEKISSFPSTVLITGESGTGKELVAEALHYQGDRKNHNLIKVNCSALPENLIESELFGHEKGSFTGALKDKTGRFKIADGGTIFLDEIGDISPKVQVRLLRVLQEKEIEPVGYEKPIKVDVRIIAATNKNLKDKVSSGEFREDLYYRLKVVELNLPPLRNRRNDIPILTEYFIKKFNRKFNKNIKGVSDEVMKLFMAYGWPGNIRELEHTIEYSSLISSQPVITVEDLPDELKGTVSGALMKLNNEAYEIESIKKALAVTNWKKGEAAELLGINRKTLYRKMKKYNILKAC